MVDPLNYFPFQPLHDWCNKGRGSRFPLLLSEWSFTICLTPNVFSVLLNKTFPSFLPVYCKLSLVQNDRAKALCKITKQLPLAVIYKLDKGH